MTRRTRPRARWRYALALPALVGCRLGGPTGSPDEYVAFPSDAAIDGTAGGMTVFGDDATGAASDDGTGATGDDGGGDDADDFASDAGCTSTVAVCNPVHNTGCNPLQQCDVNPTPPTPGMPTGNCVFGSGSDAGAAGACTMSVFTESCAAGSTCVDGGCRQVCFCNADCPTGQCCSDTSGPAGFTLCGACQ